MQTSGNDRATKPFVHGTRGPTSPCVCCAEARGEGTHLETTVCGVFRRAPITMFVRAVATCRGLPHVFPLARVPNLHVLSTLAKPRVRFVGHPFEQEVPSTSLLGATSCVLWRPVFGCTALARGLAQEKQTFPRWRVPVVHAPNGNVLS